MADTTALKNRIRAAIKANDNQEITGPVLQQTLLDIVDELDLNPELQEAINTEKEARQTADTQLGDLITGIKNNIDNGYVYAGIATPLTTPVSGKVFYLAKEAGTYTNFGELILSQGINILKYNGTSWSLDSFVGIDDTPTPGSLKLVKSGGVFDEVVKNGSAFDLSAYNGGATYADLNAALTALNALPAAYKRGGMSMKFVLSSDNKYVQYRYMLQYENTTAGNAAFINSDNWQGVDEEIKSGSKNIAESGAVMELTAKSECQENICLESGTFTYTTDEILIKTANNKRLRSIVPFKIPFYIKLKEGYQIRFVAYLDTDFLYQSRTLIEQNSIEITDTTSGVYACLVINKDDDTQVITTTDVIDECYILEDYALFKKEEKNKIELEDKIGIVKEESQLKVNIIPLEIGGFNTQGNKQSSNTRARTAVYLEAPFDVVVSSSFKLRNIYKYTRSTDGTIAFDSYSFASTSQKNHYTEADTDYIYKLVFNKNTDTDIISVADLPSIITSYKGDYDALVKNVNTILDEVIESNNVLMADTESVLKLEVGGLKSNGTEDNTTTQRARTAGYIQAPFEISTLYDTSQSKYFRLRTIYKYIRSANGAVTVSSTISLSGQERYRYIETDTNYIYKIVFDSYYNSTQYDISPADLLSIVLSFKGEVSILRDKVLYGDSISYLSKFTGNTSVLSAHFGGNLLAEYSNASGSAAFTFPEYSQYNILLAKKAGFDVLGINIDKTSDSVVVCSHDLTINRTMRNKSDYSVLSNPVTISENTYSDLKNGYIANTSIERLRLPLLRLEDALKTCKSLNLGVILLPNSTTGVLSAAMELMEKYGFTDYGILSNNRPEGFNGLVIGYSASKKTTSEVITLLDAIGHPACFMMDDTVSLYTEEELKELADTVHANRYLLSASLHGNKSNFYKLRQIGAFDFSNVDNDVPVFENGDVESIRSIIDFASFTYTGSQAVFNGVLQEDESLSHSTQNPPTMCKACLKVHFKGTFELTFGTGYSELEVNSDGSFIGVFTNVFYNAAPSFTIVASEETEIYDIEFDVSKIM